MIDCNKDNNASVHFMRLNNKNVEQSLRKILIHESKKCVRKSDLLTNKKFIKFNIFFYLLKTVLIRTGSELKFTFSSTFCGYFIIFLMFLIFQ